MTTPTLDPDAYRRGWHDSANGAPARVPDEYDTDATISGYVWGWVDYVLAMTRKDEAMKYHVIYTVKAEVHETEIECASFADAEKWAEEQDASYWEVGVSDDEQLPKPTD